MLIEVLSASTADEDQGEKFREYSSPWAEGPDAAVAFPSLGITLSLADVYAGVTFPPPPPSVTG